jgi:hypothetical protein
MREELRQRARKINSMIFKAKATSTSASPGGCSPSPLSFGDPTPGGSRKPREDPGSSGSALDSPHDKGREGREHKKKRKKDKKFEGVRVPHLAKVRPFRQPAVAAPDENEHEHEEGQRQQDAAANASAQDDYVLAKLFSKSGGILSALRHDAIVDDDGTDHALLEAEAARVAKAAVRALRESRRHCARPGDSESTAVELSSASPAIKRFGKKKKSFGSGGGSNQLMTSADLLARIRTRNSVVTAVDVAATGQDEEESLFFPATASSREAAGEELGARHSELLADIRNFIAFQVRGREKLLFLFVFA